jgi:2-polyprenyl-3-methyl-5-hydroxy-6-metoxy-1,4-benzoquinol methylase
MNEKQKIKDILSNNNFIKAVLSGKNSTEYNKIEIRQILLQDNLLFQITSYTDKQTFHKNLSLNEAVNFIDSNIEDNFKNLVLFYDNKQMDIRRNKKGLSSSVKTNQNNPKPSDLEHNKAKNYILQENETYDFLMKLNIQTQTGEIKSAMRGKFIQINKFLEIVEKKLEQFDKKDLSIIDFGCGKGYLTFALYYYLKEIKKLNPVISGVDFNQDLIDKSNNTAKELNFENLKFYKNNVGDFTPKENYDIVISLHACNTATDDVIKFAINNNAKVILSTPCCQQEFIKKIDPENEVLKNCLEFGLVKERMSALLTDTYRCFYLQANGYNVKMTEFIDPEYTGKNVMIEAIKTENYKENKKANKKLEDFKELWGLKDIYLANIYLANDDVTKS